MINSMQMLPPDFVASLSKHFPPEIVKTIIDGINQPASVSIRINPQKPIASEASWQAVPWHDRGYLIPERPKFALDPRFHAGAYYVQDSSSMILAAILKKLEIPTSSSMLDTCAAPGGKSGILLEHLNGDGFLVSNEIDSKRQSILQENLLKLGYANYITTSVDTQYFASSGARFDVVLIDAPCSGEGMFRKDEFAVNQWNKNLIKQCVLTQSNIIENASQCVAEGGYLIYATCTLNPDENESQIRNLLAKNEFELALPRFEWEEHLYPVEEGNNLLGYYLLPGRSTGEGLFISVLQRTAENPKKYNQRTAALKSKKTTLTKRSLEALETLCDADKIEGLIGVEFADTIHLTAEHEVLFNLDLPIRMIGMPGFVMKGKNFIPAHGLAMLECCSAKVQLTLEEALAYLRRETLSLPPEIVNGWTIVAFEGRHLGWLKVIDKRTNNYYPTWLKLRI